MAGHRPSLSLRSHLWLDQAFPRRSRADWLPWLPVIGLALLVAALAWAHP